MADKYLISGDDDYEIKALSQKIVSDLLARYPDTELDLIDAENVDRDASSVIQDFITALQMDSLFGSEKLVWLKHASFFAGLGGSGEESAPKKGRGKAVKSDLLAPLTDLIAAGGIPETMTVIIDGSGIDRRKAFYKTCAAAGFKTEWLVKPDPKDRQYAQQLHSRMETILKECGLTASGDAMECLKGMLGGDSARMRTEIEKLACYMGTQTKVTRSDCMAACSHTPEALGWAMTDALKAKDVSRALIAIDELITQMESERSSGSELCLVSGAANEFQSLIRARAALDELGIDPRRVNANTFSQFSKEQYPDNVLLGMHPFRAFKVVESLGNFPDQALVSALDTILKTNRELVSGGADNPRIALERMVFKIINP